MQSKRKIFLTAIAFLLYSATTALADPKPTFIEIILDSSGSMWGQVQGKAKIDIAKQVFEKYLNQTPENIQLGLRVYGHRQKKDCSDIELVQQVGPIDKTTLLQKVKGLTPLGMTPITDALEQAASNLEPKDGKRLILLITDGIESCNKDPCAFAKKLAESKIEYFAEVVGFDVKEKEATEQLTCIAKALHGNYYSANSADDLLRAMSESIETVAKQSSLIIQSPNRLSDMAEVYDTSGKKISEFLTFYMPAFPPGTYKVVVKTDPPKTFENVIIKEGEDTIINVAGFGQIKVDAPIALSWTVHVKDAAGHLVREPFYGSYAPDIPVGVYRVEVHPGIEVTPKPSPFIVENVEVKNQETTPLKVTGYGFLTFDVYNPLNVYVDILDVSGKKLVNQSLAFQRYTLPLGSYTVTVKKGDSGTPSTHKNIAIQERETTTLKIP